MVELNFILSHVLFNKKSIAEPVLPIQSEIEAERFVGYDFPRGNARTDVENLKKNLSSLSKTRQGHRGLGDMIYPRGNARTDVENLKKNLSSLSKTRQGHRGLGDMNCPRGTARTDVEI